jgi:hypothetical protein
VKTLRSMFLGIGLLLTIPAIGTGTAVFRFGPWAGR